MPELRTKRKTLSTKSGLGFTSRVFQAPFGPRDFSALVRFERIHQPPFAWHLPGRQASQSKLFERLDGGSRCRGNTGNYGFATLHIAIGNAEGHAVLYLRMRAQRALDQFRSDLATSDIYLVPCPAP